MTSTRWTTLLAFALGSVGIAIAATNDSIPMAFIGAALFMAAILALVRHFWRQNEVKRQQSAANLSASISALRSRAELTERSILAGFDQLTTRVDIFNRGLLEYMAQLDLDVSEMQAETVNLPKSMDQVGAQLAGVVGLYAALEPAMPYPAFGGWAIGGDCAQRLVTLILAQPPSWIIEVGSGLSTLLAAHALEVIGGDGRICTLEHEAAWVEKTWALLEERGLSHRAEIVHAPLVEIDIEGEPFNWYDLRNAKLPEQAQIIFIDGPPKSTGENARYPALPLLLGHLSPTGVVLMDDASRPDERAAVERWTEEIPDLEITFHPDAKGTVEIRRKTG